MKIATLLFTYDRSWHTEQVLVALSKSYMLPEKLFIFQDGLRKDEDSDEWKKVNGLIKRVDWCDTEIIVSGYNKGLASSIVTGIAYAFEKYDAVIVLEDDCVPAVGFMSFMTQCFEKYESEKRIYSVSGYSYPIDIRDKNVSDIYFCGRISSWGWGTWKDRWEKYEQDYTMLQRMKHNREKSIDLALWGRDLEDMLVSRVRGDNDSWAVFWAMKVIEEKGLCINPYNSLIQNIGLDGSGVHCGVSNVYDVILDNKYYEEFSLLDIVGFQSEIKEAFAPLYGSYTAISEKDNDKEIILVYGVGGFFKRNEKELNQNYYIEKFVDRFKKGYYAGRKIIRPDQIKNCEFKKIVIMIQDEREALIIAKDIINKYDVAEEKVELGNKLYC